MSKVSVMGVFFGGIADIAPTIISCESHPSRRCLIPDLARQFDYTLAPNSVTMLRLKKQNR